MDITMGCLRVYAPNEAMRAGLPRELRRYIGRWAQEETADTYTRDVREVVVKAWRQMMEKQDSGSDGIGVRCPVDIRDRCFYD